MRHRRFHTRPKHVFAPGDSSGFTMLEVLMVIAILSIAFGTIYKTFDTFNRAYTTENVVAGVQQKTRIGVEFMVQDIRQAGLDPFETAGAGITKASLIEIRFSADRDVDGVLDEPLVADGLSESDLERIGYAYDSVSLLEMFLRKEDGSVESQDILLDNVTGLTFGYLDGEESDLIDYSLMPPEVPPDRLDEIRTVVISLTTQRPAGRDEPVSRTYTTRVRCRNL
ncbi:MAG: prepilin-type N-terminal cleavage/methylation domain-containing protein [Desulfobacterales bacterium]|nr:MAG: prepilin-type N-terminal cleavage/methylation domain-containing protein [Desulfobacterales bacterium]